MQVQFLSEEGGHMSGIRGYVSAFLFLFLAISGRAQSNLVNLSVTETEHGPVFVVTNHNTPAITASLVTTVSLTRSGKPLTRFYFDTYVNYRRDYPIVTRDSEQMSLPHIAGRPAPQPVLRAVIFEDGSSWGEVSWVNELLQRRALVLRALDRIDRILEAAARQNLSKENLLGGVQQERALEAVANTGLLQEHRILEDSVFQTAIANLNGGIKVNGKVPKVSEAIFYMKRILNSWRGHLQSAKPSPPPLASFAPPVERNAPIQVRAALEEHSHTRQRKDAFSRSSALQLVASRGRHYPASNPMFRISPSPPQSCSYGNDTEKVEGPTTCGNNRWHLQVNVGFTEHDYGFVWAYGVCVGGFTDCWNVYNPQSSVEGSVNLRSATAPPYQVAFYWDVESWYNEYFDCDCTDPNPQAFTQGQFVTLFPTPTYYVDCP